MKVGVWIPCYRRWIGGDEIRERQLELVHEQASGAIARREAMPFSDEEEDVRRLRNEHAAGLEERWRERGTGKARIVEDRLHALHAGLAARDVDVRCGRFLEGETHELAASLDGGPVEELVAHRRLASAAGGQCRLQASS